MGCAMQREFLVITGDNCTYCDQAKALLTEKGHAFEEVHVLDVQSMMIENGWKTVPQIIELNSQSNVTHVGGYTELKEMLDAK